MKPSTKRVILYFLFAAVNLYCLSRMFSSSQRPRLAIPSYLMEDNSPKLSFIADRYNPRGYQPKPATPKPTNDPIDPYLNIDNDAKAAYNQFRESHMDDDLGHGLLDNIKDLAHKPVDTFNYIMGSDPTNREPVIIKDSKVPDYQRYRPKFNTQNQNPNAFRNVFGGVHNYLKQRVNDFKSNVAVLDPLRSGNYQGQQRQLAPNFGAPQQGEGFGQNAVVDPRQQMFHMNNQNQQPAQQHIPPMIPQHQPYQPLAGAVPSPLAPLQPGGAPQTAQDEGSDEAEEIAPQVRGCPYLRRLLPPNGGKPAWQRVGTQSSGVLVFSAFMDRRLGRPLVRIIAVSDRQHVDPVYCQVWMPSSSSVIVMEKWKTVRMSQPNEQDRYSAVEYLCEVPSSSEVPIAVSLVMDECEEPANILPVTNTIQLEDDSSFGVCVPPLHYNYNDVYQFVEMVEINRLFGAQKIIMYNHTLGADIVPYLNSYIREGVIEVVSWQIPVAVDVWPPQPGHQADIHYFGQLAAMNDCLYRMMSSVRYIAFTDMDELAVPRLHHNWLELIQHVQKLHGVNKKIGAYTFKNTFFKLDFPSDEEYSEIPIIKELKTRTLLKTRREPKIFDAGDRSKMIVDVRGVEIMGIHNVWKFNQDYTEYVLPEELGLLHHYRFWDTPDDKNWIEDKNMRRFMNDIVLNVKQRFSVVTRRT